MGSLSSFFKPSQSAKFTPTKIKFADFYKSATQGGKLGGNVLTTVKETMRKAGYTDVQIAKMITANEALPVARIKEIATHLSRGKVYGFDQDPDRAVKKSSTKNASRRKASPPSGKSIFSKRPKKT